ncbi:MAG: DUF748 domain-containing protein [Bacteroidia bacterium]|nr:DUF748 domain-containing protein [Bacteroidia bacterium]
MKTKYKILIGIVVVLVIARIILPYVVLHYANKNLATMHGYYGHIEDIDIALLRGAYTINDIYLNKTDTITKDQSPFFKAAVIDLSVEWAAILDGSIVGELRFDSPVLIFTKDKVEISDIKKDTSDFHKLLNDFMPLKVNRFEVKNGTINYIDKSSAPAVDIALNKAHILALNLTNVTEENFELPSTVTANAEMYEGTLTFNMKLNLLSIKPAFDLNAEVKNTNLVLLNDFLRAYGNFDVNKGTFGLYTEMATKDGQFRGYVKPFIKDLDVVGPRDKKDNIFNKIYEQIVGAAGVILKNPKEDQVATRVEIEGKYDDPQTNTLDAIWEVLRNAFIRALIPRVDNIININSVETEKEDDKRNILQRIFTSDKDKGDDKDKGKDKIK